MNCNEYRQALTAEPDFDGAAAHVAECADCRAWRAGLLAFDANIRAALAIDVPALRMPELPPVDTTGVTALGAGRSRKVRGWLALAASTVLAVAIGYRLAGPVHYDSLADEVLAHVDHEPRAMQVTDVGVPADRLAEVTRPIAAIGADAPLVTYARSCVINGRDVPHLVVQGERGPVMILLMPEEPVEAAIPLEDEDNRGVILPVGRGSIAIVGARDEPVDRLEKRIRNSVTWKT